MFGDLAFNIEMSLATVYAVTFKVLFIMLTSALSDTPLRWMLTLCVSLCEPSAGVPSRWSRRLSAVSAHYLTSFRPRSTMWCRRPLWSSRLVCHVCFGHQSQTEQLIAILFRSKSRQYIYASKCIFNVDKFSF